MNDTSPFFFPFLSFLLLSFFLSILCVAMVDVGTMGTYRRSFFMKGGLTRIGDTKQGNYQKHH